MLMARGLAVQKHAEGGGRTPGTVIYMDPHEEGERVIQVIEYKI